MRESLPPDHSDHRAVVLFGASGHGRAVADVLARLYIVIAARVDPTSTAADDVPHLTSDEDGIRLAQSEDLCAVVAIGDNRRRVDLTRKIEEAGLALPSIVARTATVHRTDSLGAGCVVMEHAHVGPGAVCGVACIVNTGATVEHDCRLSDGVHCAPGSVLGGGVACEANVLIGTGAVVLPLVHIAAAAVIGAGAVVTRSVSAGTTAVGAPARELRPDS